MSVDPPQAKLVLADDNQSFIAVCKSLLLPDFELAAIVRSGPDALDAVAEHHPDVLVLDLSMPGMSGVEVIEALKMRGDDTRIVVLTLHQETALAKIVMDLGASGYVVKARMARDLPKAIRAALAGEQFQSPLPP